MESSWRLARNLTRVPGVQQMSLGDVAACEEAKQTNAYRYTAGRNSIIHTSISTWAQKIVSGILIMILY